MNHHVGGSFNPTPSEAEVETARKYATREAKEAGEALLVAIDRSGSNKVWQRLARLVVPAAGDVAVELIAATKNSSPGGRKITREEAQKIARKATNEIYQNFVDALCGELE